MNDLCVQLNKLITNSVSLKNDPGILTTHSELISALNNKDYIEALRYLCKKEHESLRKILHSYPSEYSLLVMEDLGFLLNSLEANTAVHYHQPLNEFIKKNYSGKFLFNQYLYVKTSADLIKNTPTCGNIVSFFQDSLKDFPDYYESQDLLFLQRVFRMRNGVYQENVVYGIAVSAQTDGHFLKATQEVRHTMAELLMRAYQHNPNFDYLSILLAIDTIDCQISLGQTPSTDQLMSIVEELVHESTSIPQLNDAQKKYAKDILTLGAMAATFCFIAIIPSIILCSLVFTPLPIFIAFVAIDVFYGALGCLGVGQVLGASTALLINSVVEKDNKQTIELIRSQWQTQIGLFTPPAAPKNEHSLIVTTLMAN